MNRDMFKSLCKEKYIILDGATGSNLMKAGMPAGVCPEKWIMEHPQELLDLQKAYVEAGSDIIFAPTFTANRIKLSEYGLENKMEEIIPALVDITKQAAGEKALVAGDIAMTGKQLAPMGTMTIEDLIDVYKEQIALVVKAGVDLLVVETMMSLAETRTAVIAAKEVCDLPIMASLTFEADGRTLYGTDAKTAAVVLDALGVDAIGINCGTGPKTMLPIIEAMAEVTKLPIIAKPNAGLPKRAEDGCTYYSMSPEAFAEEMKLLVEAGASILGGCCGTAPEYIAKVSAFVKSKKPVERELPTGIRRLTSERQMVSFGLDDPFMIVGERINPTGKKALQAQLREGCLDLVVEYAQEQEECGAALLDVNMGMSGIDEKEMMLRVISELSTVTNLPLVIDSSHVDVIEAALRAYPGRALVNSVSFETEKVDKLLPIVKKYGAMFILLPLSDAGLPKDLAEKKDIINKLYEKAFAVGLKKEDIIVDGLVTTVGANKMAGVETLETIRYAKEMGLATICGLSNISFGMPGRVHVNSAFLNLAIMNGLTMAIANPSQEQLVAGALATDVLLAKEGSDIRYITYANNLSPVQTPSAAVKKSGVESDFVLPEGVKGQIMNAVLKGNRNGIVTMTKDALAAGEDAKRILDEALLPSINLVGDLFEKKKYFLPQLIAGAEAMKNAIEVLEPHLVSDTAEGEKPVVVIATVEGDIHDIGKNLVALMLKNYGFTVYDLGKDIPARDIVDAAKKYDADVIGLSALMTTTMQKMREVVNLVKEEGLKAKVMVGGAVITQDYADEISADGYGEDAADAVKIARKILGIVSE